MQKMLTILAVYLLAFVCLAAMNAGAQAPNSLSYQGRLTETNGDAVVSDTSVIFSIYDALSGGTQLWIDTIIVSPDSSGIFTTELAAIPNSVFQSGVKLYLEIQVLGDTPMQPRQLMTSAPYSYATEMIADASVTTAKLANNAVTSAKIASQAVGTSDIQDNSIVNADISTSAGIAPNKIAGEAVNLNYTQTITGTKTFTGNVYFSDSAMRVNANGVRIGDGAAPSLYYPLALERNYNTSSSVRAIDVGIYNEGTGNPYGLYIDVDNATASTSSRYGITAYAGSSSNTGGVSYGIISNGYGGTSTYGVYSLAYDGGNNYGVYGYAGTTTGNRRGIYGSAGGTATDYAGYFYGNVECTGGYTKGSGGFLIDHPADPENKYLSHSDVESPDMMNIYNGNIVTDGNGLAVVDLPDYFESLNSDFRYQLTVIGNFAQAIVADEINGNQFTIRTDKPSVKVSWQVTGIRKDVFAKSNPVQVERDKPANEVGLYLHPEARGLGNDYSIERDELKKIEQEKEEIQARRAREAAGGSNQDAGE